MPIIKYFRPSTDISLRTDGLNGDFSNLNFEDLKKGDEILADYMSVPGQTNRLTSIIVYR